MAGDVGAIGCVQADARLDRVRAFVKIQDGCSFSCNFCVIPLVRGASRSRRADAVLGEVRRRVEQGHREIVLTGINLGCFRDRDAGYDLPRLVREVGATPGLDRLRLSSIEINHVSRRRSSRRCARRRPSRSTSTCRSSRATTASCARCAAATRPPTYLRRLEPLAGEFNLTSDVIVGFPAEDEAAFERTLATVERAGLTKVHVFPYSPRPGTVTARRRPGPAAGRRRSAARACARSRTSSSAAAGARSSAREDVVLVDRPGRGYGDDYSPFLVDAPVGELVRVRARAIAEEGILAVAA